MTATRLAGSSSATVLPQIQQSSGRGMQTSMSSASVTQRNAIMAPVRRTSGAINTANTANAASAASSGRSGVVEQRTQPHLSCLSVQDIKELTRQRLAREAQTKDAVVQPSSNPVLEPLPSSRGVDTLPSGRLSSTNSMMRGSPNPTNISPSRLRFENPVNYDLTVSPPQSAPGAQLSSRPTSRPETLSPGVMSPTSNASTPNSGITSVGSTSTQNTSKNGQGAIPTTGYSPFGNGNEMRLGRALTLLNDGNGSTGAAVNANGFSSGLPHHSLTQNVRPPMFRGSSQPSPLATVDESAPDSPPGLRAMEPKPKTNKILVSYCVVLCLRS
jgi:hypothetical protein